MEQYISKSALVAEIERRRDESWLGNYTKEKGIIFDITDEILSFIDTLEVKEVQEEPVSRTPADIESAMQEVEEKSRAFTEAHQGESSDEILAQMHGEEPVSEELEDAVNAYIGYAPEVDESSSVYGKRQAFKAGAKWQKANLWKPADGDLKVETNDM